jgi:hypothetical protein
VIFRLQRISHQSAVGANRLGQPESLWNVPLSLPGMCLRFSSSKNITHISARKNLWFSPGLNCKMKISSSRKNCFLRHKKMICPLHSQDCHYPDHDCTPSKFLVWNYALLGYYTASNGNFLPTFRDNPSVSSSWILDPRRWDS